MPKPSRVPPESPFPKGIPQPALCALASLGITRLDQEMRLNEAQLPALYWMGPKALGIIKAELGARGKSLARKP